MVLNPLAVDLEASAERLKTIRKRRAKLTRDLDWHRAFDKPATTEAGDRQRAACDALGAEKLEVNRELTDAQHQAQQLEPMVRLGWRPTYWLSHERRDAKEKLSSVQGHMVELEERQNRLKKSIERARASARSTARALNRFERFDPDATRAAIASLEAEISLLHIDHERLAGRKEELDRQLQRPLEVLDNLRSEQREAVRRRDALLHRLSDLQADIDSADELDRLLSAAPNGYERRIIHERCERALGSSSPRAVVSDRRRQLREVKRKLADAEGTLRSFDRNIEKAELRVGTIVRRGARDVRALIVDGSNLCYQGTDFIGLAALRALSRELSRTYDVTLVFDASIRHKLAAESSRDLQDAFPGATVHVVAARTQADETILAAAQDPSVYVLSNDRFREYLDKSAVKEGRLITHEIINGQVLVPDLEVSVTFRG